ncbi:4'-phosphopantetheinyl transferase [Roseimicrobium gellanilyticum]|uniref:4'-phosphopantetheinyl transferase n=1 Tax=Roseimicrobium gellanilyticum TaxID=748857 RepID=A0A366HV87_9BACT|nr:4'-phosphopantetheinyl transferase superfamily protein [Roseimicrobium gellanilyticum]RBP47405.1 4'-phosphopantetheinyl transferase [Roseimicrobium gellanilyticum]
MSESGDRIHLYLCRPHWVTDADHLARCHDLLDDEEKTRHARFRFERDARLFLISHALVRTALSDFTSAEVPPVAWVFRSNAYGRPEVVPENGIHDLRFSLSHTHGLAVCAITSSADIGVDTEAESRKLDTAILAPRIMSPAELARFQSTSSAMQRKQFLSLWTLKEAFTKARGLGLNLPVEKLNFFVNGSSIHFGCPAEVEDKPRDWEFHLMQAQPEHHVALVTRKSGGTPASVTPRWFVPLAGDRNAEPPLQMIARA